LKIDRRQLFVGAGLLGLAGSGLLAEAVAQPASPPAPQPSRSERLAAAARGNRLRIEQGGDGGFSGAGWDRLVDAGREAQFFLLGEEHGIAENPQMAAALFRAFVPAGYSRVAIEISPTMAGEIDRALLGGIAGMRRLYADEGSRAAFFGLRQEAEMLAAMRAALPGRRPFLWGCDYEVGGDRRLIAMLRTMRKPAAAQAALIALEAASNASWARYHETRNPQFIYGFSGDPALVGAVRSAWPGANAQAREILTSLEETFEINRLFMSGRGYDSNLRRSRLLRTNFLNHWRAERAPPKVFMKFGASHLMRGVNTTDTFDLGALVPEIAGLAGTRSYSLLVLAGAGRDTGNFDPTTYSYRAGRREQYQAGMEPFTGQAFDDAFTLFDTAPLRPIARSSARDLHPELIRAIHSFDAILVMSGSTPATNL
jgi:hypothetical protein